MKKVSIVLLFALLSFGAGATELIVPDQYSQVSEAIAVAVSGDTIMVRPGQYVDTYCWNPSSGGIKIIGLGDTPSAVKYLVPRPQIGEPSIFLWSDCTLENIQVGTLNTVCDVISVVWKSQNVAIRNVVISPIVDGGGITVHAETSAEIAYVTFAPTTVQFKGVAVSETSTTIIHHCVFQNLENGMLARENTTEQYNLFWNVETPSYFLPPDPSDIVNVSDPMLDPTTFAPGYGSLAVDSGDPGYFDPDGTIVDRGAVYRSQVLFTLEFLTDPKDEVKIGLPRRQGLPPRMFHAGDRFVLASRLVKTASPPNLTSDPTLAYLALECYGTFYWAPTWTMEVDAQNIAISDGYDVQTTVFDFIWPVVGGSASGLHLWATTITSEGWVGPLACLQFGYE